MIQLDYKKDYKKFYFPRKGSFEIVEVPALNFLMIDGHGDPNNSPFYAEAVSALYSLAYGLKFALKPLEVESVVAPLEGLWWAEDMAAFTAGNKDQWNWTMMIMQPEQVSQELFESVRQKAIQKKRIPAFEKSRLEVFEEGRCAQTMYLGFYKDEGPTIARLHDFIHQQGFELSGKHHEIYLGDPRKSAPEKLKTVIRQPMKPG